MKKEKADPMMNALLDVGIERRRQIEEEGFGIENDGFLCGGVLARMGACYARHVADHRGAAYPEPLDRYRQTEADEDWPGPVDFWKPSMPRRDLVKAAALIVAEIERIDRGET